MRHIPNEAEVFGWQSYPTGASLLDQYRWCRNRSIWAARHVYESDSAIRHAVGTAREFHRAFMAEKARHAV